VDNPPHDLESNIPGRTRRVLLGKHPLDKVSEFEVGATAGAYMGITGATACVPIISWALFFSRRLPWLCRVVSALVGVEQSTNVAVPIPSGD
jgi:hypothetical protein